jgi:PDZ domain-containing secreted protein
LWKEIRVLFMIVLLLLMLVMFYPYYTGSPMDKERGREMLEEENRHPDSLHLQQASPAGDSLEGMGGR